MRHPILTNLALLFSSSLGVLGGANDWMAPLDGALPLSQLSIPGTHDTGARFEPLSGTAKCQTLTIREQLDVGVRFMDIRCRHINDGFAIHHGQVYQKASGYQPNFLGLPNITKVSNSINPRLATFFEANPKGRYGVILMDFIYAETASLIYKTNMPHLDQASPDQR